MKFLTGNLLESNAEALVNTVGVMGKGIALQFKERFPTNYKVYKKGNCLGSYFPFYFYALMYFL
jgi:O-acetyl-ADP-ribose deacetylase (regulator of RNase III)